MYTTDVSNFNFWQITGSQFLLTIKSYTMVLVQTNGIWDTIICKKYFNAFHWNWNVIILTKSQSLASQEVVILTTF